jgi:hypothetical protein
MENIAEDRVLGEINYINYYLKAAALLLNVLERQKVSSRPADYSILLY